MIARQAMLDRGLLPDFPAAVVAEAPGLLSRGEAEGAAGKDLRGLGWFSIDNEDSLDLDQLSFAEPAGAGATRVLVAIADVDALVPRDSLTDGHARHNTTSVYTPAEIFPLLPAIFSNARTSLMEGEERAAVVVEMILRADGELDGADVYRARVRNQARLSYNPVARWLDQEGPPPAQAAALPGLGAQLRLQDRCAQALRARRHSRGALNLETGEPRAFFDGEALAGLRVDTRNRARELIEDLMIAANGVTARFLEERGFPSLRRVLGSPGRWPRIVALAAGLGDTLPEEPNARALASFLATRRQADPEKFPDLSLAVVKLMGKGEYQVELPGAEGRGHFGLAAGDYTHATAPNRRFPDLITQRLLKAALEGKAAAYDPATLQELAGHCTAQENNAAKVERQVRKSAAALLLESRIGEHFAGIVTGAADKGTWVRIFDPPVEGRVVRGFSGLDVGERVTVELLETDVERGFIDFARRCC